MQINENIKKIADYIASGEKQPSQYALGMEIEHFVVDLKTKESLNYEGERGIEKLLEMLSPNYSKKIYENGRLIGLEREDMALSLEPAAQLETSIFYSKSLASLKASYDKFIAEVTPFLAQFNAELITVGYQPKSRIDSLALIPKERYRMMYAYLGNTGAYAHNMMKGTASVQVAIDYFSEADFSLKYRLANILGLFFAFLTDNIAVFEGKANKMRMMRNTIWNNTDSARCIMPPNALDKNFTYTDYAAYIYNTPMIITTLGGKSTYTAERPLYSVVGEKAMGKEDIAASLGMVFPNVRVKKYLEIRTADCMPKPYAFAYAALVKGLFYSEQNLKKYDILFRNFNNASYQKLEELMQEKGSECSFNGENIYDFALELCSDAAGALSAEEKEFLQPFESLFKEKRRIFE